MAVMEDSPYRPPEIDSVDTLQIRDDGSPTHFAKWVCIAVVVSVLMTPVILLAEYSPVHLGKPETPLAGLSALAVLLSICGGLAARRKRTPYSLAVCLCQNAVGWPVAVGLIDLQTHLAITWKDVSFISGFALASTFCGFIAALCVSSTMRKNT